MTDSNAWRWQTEAMIASVRLSGRVLCVLIENGMLTESQAIALVNDASSVLAKDNPSHGLFEQLAAGLKQEPH